MVIKNKHEFITRPKHESYSCMVYALPKLMFSINKHTKTHTYHVGLNKCVFYTVQTQCATVHSHRNAYQTCSLSWFTAPYEYIYLLVKTYYINDTLKASLLGSITLPGRNWKNMGRFKNPFIKEIIIIIAVPQ